MKGGFEGSMARPEIDILGRLWPLGRPTGPSWMVPERLV